MTTIRVITPEGWVESEVPEQIGPTAAEQVAIWEAAVAEAMVETVEVPG